MKEKINELKKVIESKLSEAKDLDSLNELKITYLGKNGPVSELTNCLKIKTYIPVAPSTFNL